MKHVKAYFLLLALFSASISLAQKKGDNAIPISFPDSVHIVLENTRNVDASVVGSSFALAWPTLSVDQQITVQKQVRLMKKKKFPVKPTIINYFGAVANAVSVERADASVVSAYLKVAGQVIENEKPAAIQNFFAASRTFFRTHSLYSDRTFRLHVQEDDYTFEYIATPSFDLNEPLDNEVETVSTNGDNASWDDNGSNNDESFYAEAPLWMNPPPPPIVEGPVIRFTRATLNFATRYDSVQLKNTKGVFSLRDNLFVGENGTFDWSAAGLSPDSVYCTLTTYYFKATKPEFKADVVKLNYTGKTPGFIPGTFEFKSVARKESEPSSYPRFRSYESNLLIQGLADENVRYSGGFSLIGRKISSASVGGGESKIEVYCQGEKKFSARSTDFQFSPATIVTNRAKLTMFQRRDSVSHPAVRLKYTYNSDSIQRLLVLRDKSGMKHTPYSSSFFNIDFAADIIRWDLNTDSMNIQTDGGRHTVPLIIESIDFYDPEDFRLLKGEGFSFHPLALVATYCMKNKVRQFYSGDLVQYSGKQPRDIKAAIEFLSEKGLVTYDVKTDIVKVKEKTVLLYKAFLGEMDYDNLKIHSVIDSLPNATFNINKGYMTVRGVEAFKVSDSLNVRIKPDSSIITLLQNRDIQFDGTINAGNFEISGKGFTLKYDSFYINLMHIDSINFYVTEKNAKGQTFRRKVSNSMVGADSTAAAVGGLGDTSKSSGTLFISKPNNKSGKRKLPNYPRLDATTGGVIYFDRHEVLNGAYDRSVFFVIPPFKLDSLNDTDPASINFDGTFVSGGIFPNFKEKLHTQPDKSLGFNHDIPAPGYQLYNGDGKMNGALTLNNRGLRGGGLINFLAVSLTSQDFTFYPDSVVGQGDQGIIEPKQFGSVVFPQANLAHFDLKWNPKEDKMRIKNLNTPFEFYNGSAQMRGTLTVSHQGVAGAGRFDTRGTELISRDMNFTATSFGARHARFKVKSEDPAKPLLTGTDVRMRFNLEQNYADISPEVAGVAAIDFPYAQFKTSIPNMRWDVNAQKILMRKEPDQRLEDSYFYTTRKELDSLSFNAERAEYDLKTQQLKVSGIPYIIVADAMITPENNEVLILENAKIGTLKNTTIVLDTLNGYHRLTDGVVNIISRKEFSGYATYQYVNFLQDTFAIKLTDFHLEPISEGEKTTRTQRRKTSKASMQTVGTGLISEKDFLVLGAGMYYKGDMTMYATRPALQLTGYVKLDIKNIKNYNSWIKYSQTGDETDVLIDFDKAVDEHGKRVSAGLHFANTDNDLYITFLNDKKSEDDEDFFLPSGMLYYDTATSEFKIEDIEKARGNKLSGKVFAYNDQNLQVRFEGPLKLFRGTKDFNVTASAIGQGNVESNEIRMNSFLVVDTNIPVQAFDVMAKNIQDVIKHEGADEGLGDQTELLYKIADLIGERAVKDYEQKSLQSYVSLGTIPQLAKPLVFSNVNLKWSAENKGFYSEGKIGLSNIGRNDINGGFEGFMEIRKNEDGSPVFHVFIKASPEAWYYFGFEDHRLLVHSSNNEFNSIVGKKTNAGKAKVGEVAFIPGTDDETLAFINRFRKKYYGIDVPYSLHDSAAPGTKKKEEKKEDDDGF